MREIKFRAKRADTGAWVCGDLTHAAKINTKEQADESGKRRQPVLRVANYDVDETTIGQYTGLMDGNYREIYEGDVLEFTDPWEGYRHLKTVVFNKGAFCFKHAESKELTPMKSHQWWKYTVAGNIYDNPELIKQQEK